MDARCATYPPGAWDTDATDEDMRWAIEVCEVCPVRRPCRAYGQRNGMWGVWGGVDLKEGLPRRNRRPDMRVNA